MRRVISDLLTLFFLVVLTSASLFAAGSNIEGVVVDQKTGESLAGANVILVGTSKGAATDMDGKYVILNVSPGTYTVKVSYIGYYETKVTIVVKEGQSLKQDFKLAAVSLTSETVVVTAQAFGQTQAINQQLASDQIMNVVSAAKIQELPDANAAESIGRLPGIAVMRSGGEGNEVVVRGLAPKYNQVSMDGMRMSSSDPNDRSVDLSLLSSNMLEGIEVSKSVTADMDADVFGGVVNFELREAKATESGKPAVSMTLQGAYNGLSDATNKTNNYKYVLSGENRFLDNLFGVFAQIDIERKNLTSNELGASYQALNNNYTDYRVTGLTLYDIPRDRKRINGVIVMDYIIPDGKIKFSNFITNGSTQSQSRQEFYDVLNVDHDYTFNYSESKMTMLTNSLDYKQSFPEVNVHVKLSHSYSETKDPNDWTVMFQQWHTGGLTGKTFLNPLDIPKSVTDSLPNTFLNSVTTNRSFARERTLTGSLDLDRVFNLSDLITADVKAGAKFRHLTRSYDFDQYGRDPAVGGDFTSASAANMNDLIKQNFGIPASVDHQFLPISYFTDNNFSYGKFLGGDYQMGAPLSYGMLSSLVNLVTNNARNISTPAYVHDLANSTASDYDGYENTSAFYLESVFNIGNNITFIPGVRYQNLTTNYTGSMGYLNNSGYHSVDTTVNRQHGYWLPDASIKYKPFPWFDIRFAYSNTLAYPDYSSVIPKIAVQATDIYFNNFNLNPSKAENFDLYLSFSENTLGLFTAGGFIKRIDDLIYASSFVVPTAAVPGYIPSNMPTYSQTNYYYTVHTFVNEKYKINNEGLELDWQTHFWYLPEPFSGLVMSVNYTHIFSKSQVPYQNQVKVGRTVSYIDTSYITRLLDQPNNIVNLSLGYDYAGFSVRVSLLYQSDINTGTQFWPQLRSSTSAYRRWDLALKQDLPWYNIQVFGDINNINGAHDVSVIQGGGVPISQQDYGMNADLGLRVKF